MPSLSSSYLWRSILGALLMCIAASSFAKTEYDIKAAYLYNFIKFINWPEPSERTEPLQVCLFGEDPINEKLLPLKDVRIDDREVRVVDVTVNSNLSACTVLYIAREEKRQAHEVISQIGTAPVLVVSDIEGFAKLGGTIGFITLGNVIRFDVNLKSARDSQLSISSKLLELANQVVK